MGNGAKSDRSQLDVERSGFGRSIHPPPHSAEERFPSDGFAAVGRRTFAPGSGGLEGRRWQLGRGSGVYADGGQQDPPALIPRWR